MKAIRVEIMNKMLGMLDFKTAGIDDYMAYINEKDNESGVQAGRQWWVEGHINVVNSVRKEDLGTLSLSDNS